MSRRIAIAIGLFLAVAACSSAPEQVVERVIEAETGSDVDIDVSDDGASVSIESEDRSVALGAAVEIPPDFPLPIPEGGEPLFVLSNQGTTQLRVLYPDGDYEATMAFYDSWVAGQGGEWDRSESSGGEGDELFRRVIWSARGGSAVIHVSDCYDMDGDESGPPDAVCLDLVAREG